MRTHLFCVGLFCLLQRLTLTVAADATNGPPKQSEQPQEPPSLFRHHVAINTGVSMLNPYLITTNGLTGDPKGRGMLKEGSGARAKFFIDFALNHVWAWDPYRCWRYCERKLHEDVQDAQIGDWFWAEGEKLPLDIQAHLSYYAMDEEETTASAIVGSGSFGGEIAIGFPFYRCLNLANTLHLGHADLATADKCYDATESAHWIGVVGSYSGVTDSSAFDVHARFLLGLGYRATFKTPFTISDGARSRAACFNIIAAPVGVDTVEFLSEGTKEIRLYHEDIPRYHMRAAFALEMELYYPITGGLSAVMGSRIYTGLDPNTWNAYFGLTLSLDKIGQFLK